MFRLPVILFLGFIVLSNNLCSQSLFSNYPEYSKTKGYLSIKNLRGGKVYLVRELKPEARALLDNGVKLFGQVRKVNKNFEEPIPSPQTASAVMNACKSIAQGLPAAQSETLNLAGVGTVSAETQPELIQKVKELLAALDPADPLTSWNTMIAELITEFGNFKKMISSGYAGASSGISLYNVESGGRGADTEGAKGVVIAKQNADWLDKTIDYLIEQKAKLSSIPNGGNPNDQWNQFYLSEFPKLKMDIDLNTIDSVELDEKGRFFLDGEGELIISMIFYGKTIYFHEKSSNSPIKTIRK